MELKAINILQKDFVSNEDYFLTCEAFIGNEKNAYDYEVYTFYVIGERRLNENYIDKSVGKAMFIQKKYNEEELNYIIKGIIEKCDKADDDKIYESIKDYLIMQDNE